MALLPNGSEFKFDRGAEQGEPLGAVKAVLPLGDARGRIAAREVSRGTCDEWYIDDGQLVCAPAAFDPWLRAFDAEIDLIGATRGRGNDVKSVARVICPPERAHEFDGWATEYVKATCKVAEPNSPTVTLGAAIGTADDIRAAAKDVTSKVLKKRQAIASLECSSAELVLTRRCADVGNVNYWLRCYGDVLRGLAAQDFDKDLRAAVEESLGGQIPDTAWWQAGVGVADGGLGLRSANDTALSAFAGSRVASRPMVEHLMSHIEAAGLGCVSRLMDLYDQRIGAALRDLLGSLPGEVAVDVREAVPRKI